MLLAVGFMKSFFEPHAKDWTSLGQDLDKPGGLNPTLDKDWTSLGQDLDKPGGANPALDKDWTIPRQIWGPKSRT